MKLGWRYQPFDKGIIFSDAQQGVKLTLVDYSKLGKCKVEINFKQGGHSKKWYWEIDSWENGEEKILSTPVVGLTYDLWINLIYQSMLLALLATFLRFY